MTIPSTMIPIVAGALIGACVAALHLWASWHASRRLVHARTGTRVLLGLPLRVALPAAALSVVAWWSPVALISAALAFGLTERVVLRHRSREAPS